MPKKLDLSSFRHNYRQCTVPRPEKNMPKKLDLSSLRHNHRQCAVPRPEKDMPKKLDLSILRHKFRLSVFEDNVKKGFEVPTAGVFGSGELLEVFFVDHGDCEDAEVFADFRSSSILSMRAVYRSLNPFFFSSLPKGSEKKPMINSPFLKLLSTHFS